MAENYVGGMPGIRAERTASPRKLLACTDGAIYFPGGKVINGGKSRDPLNSGDADVLRAGVLMGRIAASGKYAPSVLGALAAAYDKDGQTATTMAVSPATAGEVVRRIGASGTFKLTGPATAGGTVVAETIAYSAVDTDTGEITVTAAAHSFIAGSLVQPGDGSQVPVGLLGDGYGLKVTNADGNDIDVPMANLLVGGVIDASQIVNYPADAALAAQVKAWLRAGGYGWCFDDDF